MNCVHHWVLPYQSVAADGVCRLCGAIKHFDGAYVDAHDLAYGHDLLRSEGYQKGVAPVYDAGYRNKFKKTHEVHSG